MTQRSKLEALVCHSGTLSLSDAASLFRNGSRMVAASSLIKQHSAGHFDKQTSHDVPVLLSFAASRCEPMPQT
jgi:hypothetical protein